jgi:uncharacterized repeat protein (TIGR01451 family)
LAANVRIYSGQNLLAERSTSIRGLTPRPKQADIGLHIEFPDTLRVGQTSDAIITLRNPGEVKLTGLNVELSWDQSLRATAVDSSNATRFRLGADGRSAVWAAQDLLPRLPGAGGDTNRPIKIAFECIAPAPGGSLSAQVTAAEGVQARANVTFQAVTNQVMPPVTPPVSPPGIQPRTGSWEIRLDDFNDPTMVGNEIRYSVTIRNNQNVPDRDVRVQLRLPPGVEFRSVVTLDGRPVGREFGENRTVSFEPINIVRAGEAITFIFVLVPQIPDVMVVRARVFSAEQRESVEAEQVTTVTPRN